MLVALMMIITADMALMGKSGASRTRINEKDGSVMIWIPGGEFVMGSNDGSEFEEPAHTIPVRGFWLGMYEITNRQYLMFVGETDYDMPDFWDDGNLNCPEQPVTGITWKDALAYCSWAGVRLPTEAEWEYAAACGEKQLKYATEDGDIGPGSANYSGVQGADKWLYASPVGSFPPNPFGIYDMAGNAWEWCSSLFQSYPYSEDDGRENLSEDIKALRVMRGGCYHYNREYCRVTDRHYHRQHLHYDYAGFRVALSDSCHACDK